MSTIPLEASKVELVPDAVEAGAVVKVNELGPDFTVTLVRARLVELAMTVTVAALLVGVALDVLLVGVVLDVLVVGVALDMLLVVLVLDVNVLSGGAPVVPTSELVPLFEMQLPVQNGDAT